MARSFNHIGRVRRAFADAERKAVAATTTALVRDIKIHTPWITGIAQESVFADAMRIVRTTRGGAIQDVSAGGGPAFYWKWLEFGNSRQKANPIIRTATAKAIIYHPKNVARSLAIEITKAVR